jgi:hypothetical protein
MIESLSTCTARFDTPTLVTALPLPEHDGEDRFASEHMDMDMVESMNERRDMWSAHIGRATLRPASAHPSLSVSELEAEFEVRKAYPPSPKYFHP